LKDFITESLKAGVIVEVNLFSAHYGGGWNYSAFNAKNNVNNTDTLQAKLVNTLQNGNILSHQERYVRKIVRELNNFPNIYFEIQNEPWADQTDTVLVHNDYGPIEDWRNTLQVVSQLSNDWHRKVRGWIKDEESKLPVKHLISHNISNFHYPITDPDPNISIFNFHYSSPLAVEENYHLNKVIGFNETGFAGSEDLTYRRQAWRFMMAGGALFNQLDYSFSVGSENGSDTTYKAPGGGSGALRAQFSILKKYLDQLDIIKFHPDHGVIKAAPGNRVQALSDGKNQYVIYIEPIAMKPHAIILNLPAGSFQAKWRDVGTGREIKTEMIKDSKILTPLHQKDLVVLISKK
jgi:hypothetical protein